MGRKLTEETKSKIRLAHLGKKLSPEHRAKVVKTLSSYGNQEGEKNPGWKGGKCITKEGYVLVRCPKHPNARSNGYYPEHRLVMERIIGRFLARDEVVHHRNEIKTDNKPENLFLTSHSTHAKTHWRTPKMRKWQSERVKKLRKERFWSTKKKVSKLN